MLPSDLRKMENADLVTELDKVVFAFIELNDPEVSEELENLIRISEELHYRFVIKPIQGGRSGKREKSDAI